MNNLSLTVRLRCPRYGHIGLDVRVGILALKLAEDRPFILCQIRWLLPRRHLPPQ